MDTDVLIVGAGPSALYAVFQLGLLGLRSVVLDTLPQAGGQCTQLYAHKPIYDIPGLPHTTGEGLTQALQEQIRPFTHPAPGSPFKQPVQLHHAQLVTGLEALADGTFIVTAEGTQRKLHTWKARAVLIAAGVGAFLPRKPMLEGLAQWEDRRHVRYTCPEAVELAQQHVVIQGDADEALACAVSLGQTLLQKHSLAPASVTLLHRRSLLNADPALQTQFHNLVAAKAIQFVVGQVIGWVPRQNQTLQALQLSLPDGSHTQVPADLYVPLLGLSPKLGPVAQWSLAMHQKAIAVDPATCGTSISGVYAIGDVVSYPGKRKLIVSGFQDATQAAFAIAERLAGHKVVLQYTTASKELHARLGRA